ncbi:MAG: PAS domain S-box protein [Ignavibacteriae bacterium]|nr:PAS domain S-box protein [Ignavibacteriota bacterium]
MTQRTNNRTEPLPLDQAFQFFFRSSHQPMWIFDRTSLAFLDVNDAAIKVYGYSRDEFLRLTVHDICLQKAPQLRSDEQESPRAGISVQHKTKAERILDVDVISHAVQCNGACVELQVIRESDVKRRPEILPYDSVQLQQVLIRMATKFVNVPIDQLDEYIVDALGTVGSFIHADRVYVFDYDFVARTMSNTYEWCAEGISREIENSQDIPFDVLPDAVEAHRRGDYFTVPRVDALPAGRFREILESQQIRSLILIPMIYGGRLLGFVGFDAVLQVHEFTNTEVMLLQVLAEILVNAEVRRRSQESLRESEEKFRALVETTNDFIWETDASGVYTYVSPQIMVMLGYAPGEVLGKTPFDLMPSAEASRVREIFDDAVRTNRAFNNLENINLHKDGHQIVLETSGVPIIDAAGNLRGYRGSDRDITHRKRAEAQLVANEQRYRTLFDLSPAGITLLDSDAKILEANEAFCRSHRHTKEELLGKNVRMLVPPSEHESVSGHLQKILSGQTLEHEVANLRKDGSTCIIELRETCVPLPNGETGVLSVANDITERKRAEEALRESEQKLRTVVENAEAIVFILDRVGTFLLSDGRGLTKLGLKPGQVVGVSALEMYKDYPDIIASIRQALAGAQSRSVTPLAGSIFDIIYSPYYDSTGRLNGVVGMAIDITERKLAEEKLRRSEELYRLLAENSSDVIWLMDTSGTLTYASPSVTSMLGYAPDDAVRLSLEHLLTRESATIARRHILEAREAIAKREFLMRSFEVELRRKDGSTVWTEIKASTVYDDAGNFKSIMGSARSISDRKNTENALRLSEEKYRRYFHEDLTGIFVSTPEGRFLDCNPSFLRIFDFNSLEQALEIGARVLYQGPEQRQLMIESLYKKKKLLNTELTLRKVDGTQVHVLENIIGTFDEEGTLLQIMGYVFDQSEQKRLEHQLLQSQKMESLGTLASGIAHDFNNILGIVLGHASLLGTAVALPDQETRHVDAILRATERGVGVVKQLLTFARKTEVLLESVRVNDVIAELAKLLQETFPKSIHVEAVLSEKVPPILADTNQMHQVLLNLCVNARDAMPAGGIITIATATTSGEALRAQWSGASVPEYVVVTVRDTGFGMSDSTRERIFEPFFTTKERGKGTGLGLAIVYGVVQAHKGFIDVQSESGEGTTFSIFFPALHREETHETGEQQSGGDVRGSETILFVEDEPMLMDLVAEFLTAQGYKVLMAGDGIAGAEIYARHRSEIALVISDLGLPRLGGDELFLMLKSLNPAVRFILASGFVDPAVKARMTREGLQHVISKPYHPSHVLHKIREVLDKS